MFYSCVQSVSSQFGAFLYGACQFGASQYDAIPVRRVSLWRDASLARVTLTRFSFMRLYSVCNFVSACCGAYYFGPCLFIIANLFIEGVFLCHSDAFLIFLY